MVHGSWFMVHGAWFMVEGFESLLNILQSKDKQRED
jgi:hypothetical protein